MALPKGLSALAVRIARLTPDGLLARTLPARLGFVPGRDLPTPDPRAEPVRLFIGPVNFAGQGWQWANAVRTRLSGVSAVSMAYNAAHSYGFPVDQHVPASAYLMSRTWQERQRAAVRDRFTHVIVEAGRSLFGDVYRQSVADQVRELQAAGLSVAMLTHGSDMRRPAAHLAAHAFSPFAPGEWELTPLLEEEASRNHALHDELGVPIFVSTPGMLADVPDGMWLPVVVDPASWRTDSAALGDGGDPPLVVHAPSSTVMKGTHLVEPIVTALADEGLVRYERIEGVPADEVPARFRAADIVLDQFRLGDYGVAACEAMAAGRLVIGNVDASVRAHVEAVTGRSVPIVQADPVTLEQTLRDVVSHRAHYRAIASAGPGFVAAVHDGRLSASVLSGFLGVAPPVDSEAE